jgi:phospholipid:diacylglycerol acyltransferase
VGIIIALFFANKQEVINLEGLIDFNLDSFLDVIPAGIVKDAKDITVRSTSTPTRYLRLIIVTES